MNNLLQKERLLIEVLFPPLELLESNRFFTTDHQLTYCLNEKEISIWLKIIGNIAMPSTHTSLCQADIELYRLLNDTKTPQRVTLLVNLFSNQSTLKKENESQ